MVKINRTKKWSKFDVASHTSDVSDIQGIEEHISDFLYGYVYNKLSEFCPLYITLPFWSLNEEDPNTGQQGYWGSLPVVSESENVLSRYGIFLDCITDSELVPLSFTEFIARTSVSRIPLLVRFVRSEHEDINIGKNYASYIANISHVNDGAGFYELDIRVPAFNIVDFDENNVHSSVLDEIELDDGIFSVKDGIFGLSSRDILKYGEEISKEVDAKDKLGEEFEADYFRYFYENLHYMLRDSNFVNKLGVKEWSKELTRDISKFIFAYNIVTEWKYAYYLPSRIRKEGDIEYGSGGPVFATCEPVKDEVLKDLAVATNLEYRFVSLGDWEKRARKDVIEEAIRSSVASIMSRNMDHLLGSHIETAITHQMPDLRHEVHELLSDQLGPSYDPSPPSASYFSDTYWQDEREESLNGARELLDSVVRGLEEEYGNYRLRRMDLIARFSTEWTEWSMGMSFFHQVVLPFMKNGLLLHFLGRGEGLCLQDVNIQVGYPALCDAEGDARDERSVVLNRRSSGGDEDVDHEDVEKLPSYTVPLQLAENLRFGILFETECTDFMKVRGGDIGVHAFHILMENILRNSAKHNDLSEIEEITLNISAVQHNAKQLLEGWFTPSDREGGKSFWNVVKKFGDAHWFVVLSSSVDQRKTPEATKKLADDIDEYLCRPLVKEGGEQDTEAWGMKEKKICAAYLAEGNPLDANDTCPDYIWAGTIGRGDQKRLAYCLRIPKASFLMHIDPSDNGT